MRLLIIPTLIFGLYTLSYGQCPTENDFIEVRVRGGVTVYGSIAIKLTYEGLIYRWTDENWNRKSYFVCLDSLNNKRLCELQKYVWENKLIDLKEDDLTPIDSNVVTFDQDNIVEFINLRSNKLSSLRYAVCDDKIEKLILMLVKLIPKNHHIYFKALTKCHCLD